MTEILPSARCGDADRDRAVATLREAHSGGFIDSEEFTARMERALAAREKSQLDHLVRDLTRVAPPAPAVKRKAHRPPAYKRASTWATGAVMSLLWCIFTVVSAWNSWMPLHDVLVQPAGAGYFLGGIAGIIVCLVTALIRIES